VKFTLRIPGRDEIEPAPAAIPAIPLFLGGVQGKAGAAANDNTPVAAGQAPNSGIAGIATPATCEANHEAKVERSAIISANGVPYWHADDMAGLPAWTEAEIVSFEKRVARSVWLGYQDAKGRAEKLLHRDRNDDDRRLCIECSHAGPGWRCAKREAFLLDQLQRCPMFKAGTA